MVVTLPYGEWMCVSPDKGGTNIPISLKKMLKLEARWTLFKDKLGFKFDAK